MQCKLQHIMKKILINQACQHTQTVSNERGSSQRPSLFITYIQIWDNYSGHFTDAWHWLRTQETEESLRESLQTKSLRVYRVKPSPCIIPISKLEATGMVLHVINEKTLPRERRYLPLRSFKCYSEITQCKHA